ncbi:unnamed protein product [Debaryomyces tyrocola]|nr:unnamed protein product [Debaryomyces tyrocola]
MISDESSLIHVMPLHKDKEEEKKGNGETILKVDCALLYKIDIYPGNRAFLQEIIPFLFCSN